MLGLNYIFFGLEIGGNSKIGAGIFFPHTVGTVIGAHKIGVNCIIYGNVTIGANKLDLKNEYPRPIIGDNVIIGTGSVLIGNISIGDNVKIEPNCLVKKNVEADVVVRYQ